MAVKTKRRRRSPLQVAYTKMKKVKAQNCNGKASTKQVKAAAKRYVSLAVKAGQTKKEATRKANNVTQKACKR